jgi:acyl carrier protein
MSDIEQGILRYLIEARLDGDGRDFSVETDLIDSRILDSFSALQLLGFLHKSYGVVIPLGKLNAENLRTVSRISELLRQQMNAADGSNPR